MGGTFCWAGRKWGVRGKALRKFPAMKGYGPDNILQQEAEARAVMGEDSELFMGQQDKET